MDKDELDPEMLERVQRWCAEAGRQASVEEIRAALAPLGWDELLAARALLADPPPARPLGPQALADLARGAPADVAAEREREGRYRSEVEHTPAGAPSSEPARVPSSAAGAGGPRSRRRGAAARQPAPPVVHRQRDRPMPGPAPVERPHLLEELLAPSGRALLERLLRERGAHRSFLLRELSAWRRPDGAPLGDPDLDKLLDHHGMTRAFAHRERDELLHAVRAARGGRAAAAARVGLSPEELARALDRLGATAEVEQIREDRRAELRRRATLTDRFQLLLEDAEHLADLGLLEELEAELRARLPEHVRALRSGAPTGATAAALARSLSLPQPGIAALAQRLGVRLDESREPPAAPGSTMRRTAPGRGPRGGSRPPSRSGSRPPSRSGSRPPSRTGSRPPPRTGAGPPPRSGSRPPPRSGSRPPPRTGSRPPPRTGARPPPRGKPTGRPRGPVKR